MKTITTAAPKGGSGKTTVTLLLAVHAHQNKQRVAIFDMNADQGNIAQWYVSRGSRSAPDLIEVENLTRDVRVLENEGYDWLFINTPPGIDEAAIVEASVAVSDAVLVPVRPSIFDIGTMETLVEICEEHRKRFAFVLCDVTPAWKALNSTAAKELATMGGSVLSARVPHRLAYVNALTRGRTGPEIDKDLADEVSALWAEVEQLVSVPVKKGRRHD
jgi:chromosome partitioning protein